MDERARIAMLARILAARAPGIEVAIGDDAAVLCPADVAPVQARLVWTIDEQVEGTHFERSLLSWRDIGWRSFMAAASDIPAMGALPWCALCALAIPGDVDDGALEEIARGQRDAAEAIRAPVVGGNLSRGRVLSITTTLLGTCARAVERRGGQAGDGLWLTGRVGLAAAGLRALRRGRGDDPAMAEAVQAWRRPRALVEAAGGMAGIAHAAVDVSDGLACDAGHIADASGVGVVLEERALLDDEGLVRVAALLGDDALDLALYGGEDYAIVAASATPLPGFRRIGELTKDSRLILRTSGGDRPIEALGFDHFRTSTPPGASRS